MHVSNDHQSDNIIFLDVVEGVDKKGHIYGLGPEAGKYKPSTSIPFDNISPSEYEHMMTVISKMSVENMTLKEQLKTHEELIRSSKVESRLLRERSHEDSCLLREQFQKFRSLFHKAIQIYLHIDLILQVRIHLRVHLLDYLLYYFEKLIIIFSFNYNVIILY
ncbi:hypothetical protein MtrunA17_Chr2g0290591 [Medicago truncatula]|uniref:Uncharacterized protein n=1 Tax=Medicago truncatula TaxID=3880 RepID=A0A396JC04_MEDTR|nr:hypothetical protein MtrunA17_Chr2g0290591 [Medicago truncatula]